jgi:hypothetical protein
MPWLIALPAPRIPAASSRSRVHEASADPLYPFGYEHSYAISTPSNLRTTCHSIHVRDSLAVSVEPKCRIKRGDFDVCAVTPLGLRHASTLPCCLTSFQR